MTISNLVEILQQNDGLADLSQQLHEAAVQEGLKGLAGVLAEGVKEVDQGTRGFLHWSNLQLRGVLSVTQAIVVACCSLRGKFVCPNVGFDFMPTLKLCLFSFSCVNVNSLTHNSWSNSASQ